VKITLLSAMLFALMLGVAAPIARAIPTTLPDSAPAAPILPDANAIETREFHFHNARLPGIFSAHQDVTAWQVTQGTWNGQSLDGLCLVLVHSLSDDGRTPAQTNCYVSEYATLAQRQALLGAFLASNPQTVSSQDVSAIRIEAAVITLQLEGQTIVLHLGLVA
jgi:hypothetical protein